MVVVRDRKTFVPDGDMVLTAGDVLLLAVEPNTGPDTLIEWATPPTFMIRVPAIKTLRHRCGDASICHRATANAPSARWETCATGGFIRRTRGADCGQAGGVGGGALGGHAARGGDRGQQRGGLVAALEVLVVGDRVGDDAGAGLERGAVRADEHRADGDRRVEVAAEVDVADDAGVRAALDRLERRR